MLEASTVSSEHPRQTFWPCDIVPRELDLLKMCSSWILPMFQKWTDGFTKLGVLFFNILFFVTSIKENTCLFELCVFSHCFLGSGKMCDRDAGTDVIPFSVQSGTAEHGTLTESLGSHFENQFFSRVAPVEGNRSAGWKIFHEKHLSSEVSVPHERKPQKQERKKVVIFEKDLYFKERGLGLRIWPRWLKSSNAKELPNFRTFFWRGINEVHFSPIMLRQAAHHRGKTLRQIFSKGIVFPNGKGVSLPHFTAMWLPTYHFRLLTHIQKNGGLSSFSHSHCSVENGYLKGYYWRYTDFLGFVKG